jgi:hypothetical protein
MNNKGLESKPMIEHSGHKWRSCWIRSRLATICFALALICLNLLNGAHANPTNSSHQGPAPRFGINLSGAEARGGDDLRPTLADIRLAVERQGFDLIRYPFMPDRMTPERIRELQILTDYARTKKVPVILDKHDYRWPPVADQIEWWAHFAHNFPDDGSVLLDLNNEPKGVDWMRWAAEAKQVIAGLRARGIRHPILLEWPGYSAIGRFDRGETVDQPCNSAACALTRTPGNLDPIRLTFLNGHRYFDDDGSGTKATCLKRDGTPRTESGFDAFAAKLRAHGLKGYITETAFGSYTTIPESCQTVGADAVADLHANNDVLLGVTWWGGGRLWPDRYPFKIDCTKTKRAICAPSPYLRMIRPGSR